MWERALTYQELTPERWHDYEVGIVRNQIIPHGYSDVYEKEYRRKDGTIFPVGLRTSLSRDTSGRPQTVWAIVRDISGRKQAEEALRASEERYRGIFEHAGIGIAISSLEGTKLILGIAQHGGESRIERHDPRRAPSLGLSIGSQW